MTGKKDLLDRFSGEAKEDLLYMPDLTLWYEWHRTRGTLPKGWRDSSLPQVARRLGVPVWLPAQLWKSEPSGIRVHTVERATERVITYETSNQTLRARWTRGPDGDWWQTEYPVTSEDHLAAAVELIQSRTYTLDPSNLSDLRADVGEDGVVPLALPKRPYSELLHDFLGWSDGLMLLDEPEVVEMLTILESKLQELVGRLADLPGCIVLSPDNLDGQFISPGAFESYLGASYRRTADILHSHGKRFVVHVGGPIRQLVKPLTAAGVDGIQGICGPPQSDTSLSETRQIVGPEITLWGGIPQDVMPETHRRGHFEKAVAEAAEEAAGDPRVILGVADRVPVHADIDRLEAMAALIDEISRGEHDPTQEG
ncbi:MAG: hypothetical protein KGY78_03825 [Anaerolineae bacterium]|nr:hypothetical protein [Anaerolineae bacterium]